ncbi:hypothetical protein NBZ79_09360 [Sneathiella marina]|uniref:Lipoprotein n=1 Tax=Sneathiella marina TaxID=2950108 RepID=A0ABY4WB82_9PROT|nr:hypothetical protein [Sneathiella marina]USG63182.1 hypothetical protein NBZ79_09360 [Sneathiella marina]
MRSVGSLFLMLFIGGCTVPSKGDSPVTTAPAPSATAAQEAIIAATQSPFYTPLVGQYLAAANRDLPKKYPRFTIEKVEFINRDLVTVFKYDSFNQAVSDLYEKGSMYWWENQRICRNPFYLELGREGISFYIRTILDEEGAPPIGSLSPVTRDYCAHSGFLNQGPDPLI